jgi:hypothetical protein
MSEISFLLGLLNCIHSILRKRYSYSLFTSRRLYSEKNHHRYRSSPKYVIKKSMYVCVEWDLDGRKILKCILEDLYEEYGPDTSGLG